MTLDLGLFLPSVIAGCKYDLDVRLLLSLLFFCLVFYRFAQAVNDQRQMNGNFVSATKPKNCIFFILIALTTGAFRITDF